MTKSRRVATMSCCCVLILMPSNAMAISISAESIEWILGTSDRVVIGRIVKVETIANPEKKDYEIDDYEVATVAISETLKGVHSDRETIVMRHIYFLPRYAREWMKEGNPIIFCLVKNDGERIPFPADKFAWILRRDRSQFDAIHLKSTKVGGDRRGIWTRDFELLKDKDAILNYIKKTIAAEDNGGFNRSHEVVLPFDEAVFEKYFFMGSVTIVLPVDKKLESFGRAWCKSEDQIRRAMGAEMLQHFQNDTNIEILKTLLKDAGYWDDDRLLGRKFGREFQFRNKVYFVRKAAFDSLRGFGLNVERPVLEEPELTLNEQSPNR